MAGGRERRQLRGGLARDAEGSGRHGVQPLQPGQQPHHRLRGGGHAPDQPAHGRVGACACRDRGEPGLGQPAGVSRDAQRTRRADRDGVEPHAHVARRTGRAHRAGAAGAERPPAEHALRGVTRHHGGAARCGPNPGERRARRSGDPGAGVRGHGIPRRRGPGRGHPERCRPGAGAARGAQRHRPERLRSGEQPLARARQRFHRAASLDGRVRARGHRRRSRDFHHPRAASAARGRDAQRPAHLLLAGRLRLP